MNVEKIKKSALDLAKEELNEEVQKSAVKKLKTKMKEVRDAQVIVKNLERELAELEKEIDAGIY